MRPLEELVRPNIWSLTPYSCARDEYQGAGATVFLDANESPYNTPINRYPDPLQRKVKAALSPIYGLRPECFFLGNGSDEAIDLVYRIFCRPGRDNVVAPDPTYGMYSVAADINDVEYRRVPLADDFSLQAECLLEVCNAQTKAIFLCSPNNPTGNAFTAEAIEQVVARFQGIVVVDEAYADFSSRPSWVKRIVDYPNLIVLRTFSKAWASAGVRLGLAFARPDIIALFNKVKYPYNVSQLTQDYALEMLSRRYEVLEWVKRLLDERTKVVAALRLLPFYEKDYPSDANFVLVKLQGARRIYDYLIGQGIVVRDRSRVTLCDDCLRITIGLPAENSRLLAALRQYNGK